MNLADKLIAVDELAVARDCQVFVRDACYYRAWLMQLLLCNIEYSKLTGAILVLIAEKTLNERVKQGSER